MKKKSLVLLSLMTAAALLSGCTGSASPSRSDAPMSGTQSENSGYSEMSGAYSSSDTSLSSSSGTSSSEGSSPDASAESSSGSSSESYSESSAPASGSEPYSTGRPVNNSPHGDSAMDVIPKAEQTERVAGERITFNVGNVFSQGKTYSVTISGVKMPDQSAGVSLDTTKIDGVLYGDFRLDLYNGTGSLIDTLKINVPRDDSFLILENAAIGKDYGYTLMSHKEEFGQENYPDMLRLDFFRQRGMAVPQYARYFAVFEDKIDELRFRQNGVEVAPIGTFTKLRGNGLLTQNLTIQDGKGGYTVIKYEYRFDVEKRCLNRTQVSFTGHGD